MSVGTFSVASATDHFISTSRCAQAEHLPRHRLQGWVLAGKNQASSHRIPIFIVEIYFIGFLGAFNKSIFFRLDRICEDCYSLFREVELHTLCKWVLLRKKEDNKEKKFTFLFYDLTLFVEQKKPNFLRFKGARSLSTSSIYWHKFLVYKHNTINDIIHISRGPPGKPPGIWVFNFSSLNPDREEEENARKKSLIKSCLHSWPTYKICFLTLHINFTIHIYLCQEWLSICSGRVPPSFRKKGREAEGITKREDLLLSTDL